jgi:hypothetical protein
MPPKHGSSRIAADKIWWIFQRTLYSYHVLTTDSSSECILRVNRTPGGVQSKNCWSLTTPAALFLPCHLHLKRYLCHVVVFLYTITQSFSDVRVRVRGLLWSPSPKISDFENPSDSDSASAQPVEKHDGLPPHQSARDVQRARNYVISSNNKKKFMVYPQNYFNKHVVVHAKTRLVTICLLTRFATRWR